MANNVAIAKVKKGDTVMLCMFTGMRVGPKEVVSCTKDTITISRNEKGEVTFSRKTGKQIDPMPKSERFASFITEDDGTYVHPMNKKKTKTKSTKKSATKKAQPEPEDEDEEEAEEERPEKKAAKKPVARKKPVKKPAPAPEPEEDEDDEDDDDDFDDDDFEEVE